MTLPSERSLTAKDQPQPDESPKPVRLCATRSEGKVRLEGCVENDNALLRAATGGFMGIVGTRDNLYGGIVKKSY
jgi:hypothetical protein